MTTALDNRILLRAAIATFWLLVFMVAMTAIRSLPPPNLGWTGLNAIALDTTTSFTDNSSTSPANITHSFTVGSISNRYIFMAVAINDNSSVITVPKWDGVTMTSLAKRNTAVTVEIFGLVNPNTGTHNLTYTIAGPTNLHPVTGVSSWSGVHQTTPTGTAASASGTASPATVNVSSATGEMVLDGASYVGGSGYTATVGAGQTQDWNTDCCTVSAKGMGSHENGAATVTMSWTLSTGDYWSIAAVPLKPASGVFPTLHYFRMMTQ